MKEIYSYTLVNLGEQLMAMQWPETVLILDPDWGATLTNKPGATSDNQPQSYLGWATDEFRYPNVAAKNSLASIDLMLKIWLYRLRCLDSIQAKYRNTYDMFDVYNAAWVSCGYITNQSEKAIKLATLRFPDCISKANGSYFKKGYTND